MRWKKGNILFLIFIGVAVLSFAYEKRVRNYLESFNSFSLSAIKLETMIGYKARIQEGFRGYVVFYSDLEGCKACLTRLGHVKEVSDNFEDIGYYAILKERTNRQQFGELMSLYEFPGEYLIDSGQILQSRMGLGDHPMLLFFNRDGRMFASLPLDVEHERLVRQLYRYLEEM